MKKYDFSDKNEHGSNPLNPRGREKKNDEKLLAINIPMQASKIYNKLQLNLRISLPTVKLI